MPERPKYQAPSSLIDLANGSVAFYVVPVISTGDTVTLSEFTTLNLVQGLNGDGSSGLTFTVSANIATLTTAAQTNVKAYLFVQGKR